jgi:cytochrome c2
MVLRTSSRSAAMLSFLLLFLPRCVAAADVEKGEIIAKRWCAACHLVAPEQKQAVADVPSFAAVARMKSQGFFE